MSRLSRHLNSFMPKILTQLNIQLEDRLKKQDNSNLICYLSNIKRNNYFIVQMTSTNYANLIFFFLII